MVVTIISTNVAIDKYIRRIFPYLDFPNRSQNCCTDDTATNLANPNAIASTITSMCDPENSLLIPKIEKYSATIDINKAEHRIMCGKCLRIYFC
jgi:hypothetical protein